MENLPKTTEKLYKIC